MALPYLTPAESHPDNRWSTSPCTSTRPVILRSVTVPDASGSDSPCHAHQTARPPAAAYSAALLPASGSSDPQRGSFHHADEPSPAPQYAHCQNQQYHASLQGSGTVVPGPSLHSCCHSIAAHHPSFTGPATAAAACTAALAELLDSLGGPNVSNGWGRLAQACGSPNAAVPSTSAHCPSATSQPTAEELQYVSQHAKEASENMLPDHCKFPCRTSTAAFGYATHAAQLADLDSISHLPFDQPPSYRLPPSLPIWSLDIPSSAEAQLIDWCDTTVLPYLQGIPVQAANSSDWHHDNQKLPLPLPLPLPPPQQSNLPDFDLQLATQSAAAAATNLDTHATDAAKPKKRKGI